MSDTDESPCSSPKTRPKYSVISMEPDEDSNIKDEFFAEEEVEVSNSENRDEDEEDDEEEEEDDASDEADRPGSPLSPQPLLSCHRCPSKFRTLRGYKNHMEKAHANDDEEEEPENENAYDESEDDNEQEDENEDEDGEIARPKLGHKGRHVTAKSGKRTTESDESTKCSKCGVTCPSKKQLKYHLVVYHPVSYTVEDGSELRVNVEVDSDGEESFSCPLCSQSYRLRGSVLRHMRQAHRDYEDIDAVVDSLIVIPGRPSLHSAPTKRPKTKSKPRFSEQEESYMALFQNDRSSSSRAVPDGVDSDEEETSKRRRSGTKKRRPPNAFTLFMKDNLSKYMQQAKKRRSGDSSNISFGEVTRQLADFWKTMPARDKAEYKRKSKMLREEFELDEEMEQMERIAGLTDPEVSSSRSIARPTRRRGKRGRGRGGRAMTLGSRIPAPNCFPIDVAAHLKILSDSMVMIGERLHERASQRASVALEGSLSVLLDCLLCGMAPLLCMTRKVDDLNGAIPDEQLAAILENLAFIMPGL